MIEIKDKEGKTLFKTELKPKNLFLTFTGLLQEITDFSLDDRNDNPDIKINELSLKEMLYKCWWGEF